jgi:protein involved in polysaccharide export with SLBB domain
MRTHLFARSPYRRLLMSLTASMLTVAFGSVLDAQSAPSIDTNSLACQLQQSAASNTQTNDLSVSPNPTPMPQTCGNTNQPNSQNDEMDTSSESTQWNSQGPRQNRPDKDAGRRKPLPPEPLTELQRFVTASTGQVLPLYGASLFTDRRTAFGPVDHAAAPPDMIIGPDDELHIHIWGQVNYNATLKVGREGEIHLPQAGTVRVAGLPYSAVAQHLRTALDRVYRNYQLSVELGQIHSIQIYAAGWVRQPGQYTVSALSSLVDAVFLCGGPSASGSMRHVELKRQGRTIADFDLYALLVRGDKSGDAQLQDGDVLFVPAAGPQIALLGSVRQPAIYELRGTETAGDLLDAAGGRTALADGARISIDRVDAGAKRWAFEIVTDAAGLGTRLNDGDIVHVASITPDYRETVTLRGAIANPGHFRWHPGMHLSELMPDRDALVSRDYWWRRAQLGLPAPEFMPLIDALKVSPSTASTPHSMPRTWLDMPVHDQELLTTPQLAKPGADPSRDPTQYPNTQQMPPDNSAQAGTQRQSNNAENTSVTLRDSLATAQSSNALTRHDLLSTPTAQTNWNYAVIERLDRSTMTTSLIPFALGRLVLQHDASQDRELEPGDVVTVFSQDDLHLPVAQQTKYVQIEGEVAHGGVYSVAPGETLRDVVKKAGGVTENAYLYGTNFTRKSTQRIEQRVFNDYVDRLEQELARNSISLAAGGSGQSGDSTRNQVDSIDRLLISKLRSVQPTGRIVFTLKPISNSSTELPDLVLEDGDRLVIPSLPATVQVIGAVYNQNAFLYRGDARVGDYLRMAGGATRNADRGKAFVLRANGSVTAAAMDKSLFASGFDHQRLYPGDTVVMPERGVRMGAMRELLNWAQLFSQLSLGAAAINVIK